ncbi:Gfo/Idh/MocA family oxidoreductase [Thalassomonas viridans]|uniref:Gfo/Idh/MocA family oxidoreductase n=1 Tax=Thalassomonas viridans TaxID=137584 RepID=A0AAF0CDQ2_9GAMM|nr:Gfo/Idh/MocA family oxidoreductase [Thalassomonas viridans]WDE08986.1 Gfo/Idh/MocA family oxidoreductase [Thalassomonas viridans]
MNIGIIGMGVISKYYVSAFERGIGHELAGVCDLDPGKLEPFKQKNIACFTDYQQMLLSHDIDAVIINLPNDVHFEACRAALLAGKHVCCEKPLTLSSKEADDLCLLARELKKTLFTSFHRRYNKNFVAMLERIKNTEDIKYVSVNYKEKIQEHAGNDTWYLNPDKCGGGCIADNGPNAFDTAAFFLGQLEVESAIMHCDDTGLDLQAQIKLRSHLGVEVDIHLDWDYPHGELKDVSVHMNNGDVYSADMLAGYDAFKSSLFHEYEAVIKDFAARIEFGHDFGRNGADMVALVEQSYRLSAQ